MRNVFINYLNEFINNFTKYGISKAPTENVLAMTHLINSVCERLAEPKAFPRETPVHVLTGLTWFSMPEFVGPFELMINTEHVRLMESDGETVNYKRTLERLKNISIMANNSFQFLNVSNYWNITSSYKNLLVPCYIYYAEGHIAQNFPLPCNEGNIKQEK